MAPTLIENLLLYQKDLSGFPYGMQRDFEETICQVANTKRLATPHRDLAPWVAHYTQPATRYSPLGYLVPKRPYREIRSDTAWLVLMGPESYPFWFFKDWDKDVKKTVLYLYDTFEAQVPLINRILKSGRWDLTITSFPAAVPMLEKGTGRQWHSVMQGVNSDRFYPLESSQEPSIAFSSYGRRWPQLHDAIKRFCKSKKLHYDYTVCSELIQGSDPCDNYEILAWHMRQSWFTVCWPVELTNPRRVLTFSPITCRWFEAAASASVVIGKSPADPAFSDAFGDAFVEEMDPYASPDGLQHRLSELWERRTELRRKRIELREKQISQWIWESRVKEIQNLLAGL